MADHELHQVSSIEKPSNDQEARLKRISLYFSIVCIAIFVLQMALIFQGANVGYIVLVGLIGAGIAIADMVFIRAKAREEILGTNSKL